jgi:signal transduction histidine kinase/CheY-like chemotaxis protein
MSVFIDGLGQQGAVRKAEYRYRHKDGRWIDLEAVGCNLLHDPAVNGIVLNIRDITERKRAEEEKAVLHAQLIQSQKMESVGRLAGGVAHDFNNVLTVILGFAEFGIDDLREGDPLRENLEEIRSASERAAAITRQLLAFSRKQVLQPIALDLNAVATGLEKMLRRLLGEDIELAQVLGPDLGIVTADRVQIEQVIVNLAINARDAMPQGGKLTIETANVELDEEYAVLHASVKPGPYVLLAVSDTGHGMDEATMTRIFEPFFTTKEVGKGTGLGLSTVYGIVKQSGGNIWVYSEPGKGTTFKIYLPCDRSAVAAGSAPAARKIPIRGGETILIVEDEEALRGLAERSLKRAGFHVLTAADGEQALLLCEKHPKPIHLLLTDVVMPRMSGRVLAERLTTVRPAMKVLFMSGYTDNAIVHHGILVPGTQFIAKPFGVVALAAKVREVLDSTPNSGAR